MKRIAYAITLTLILSLTALASGQSVTLVPKLTKGDKFVLLITKGRSQSGRPELAKTRGLQIIDVEVIESGKTILLGWTTRKTAIIDPSGKPIPLPPEAAGMATLFDGVQMIFELSPKCELIALKNLDKIKPLVTKTIDTVLASMKRSKAEKDQLRQAVTQMLSSRKTLETLYSRQLTLLLALAQTELPAGLNTKLTTETDCQFPMPIGGGVIPARMTTQVAKLDKVAKQATITMNTKMDPEKAAQAMLAAAIAMNKKTGGPIPTKKDIPKMNIQDVRTYVVDLKTNLPLSVKHQRTTTVGKNKRTDTIKIIRKPAKKTTS